LRKSNTIAFFYPCFNSREPDYFTNEIMLGINDGVCHGNMTLQIFPFAERDDRHREFYRDIILNGSIAGLIIVAGIEISRVLIQAAKTAAVPLL
jgi:DNA-binding LacI/PurR family transcriptional regulator